MTSKYLARPIRTEAQATEERRLRGRLAIAEALLADVEEYFDRRADSEDGPDGAEPNDEMCFLTQIQEFLGKPQ